MEFVKFNKNIKIDFGILTKNPDIVSENDFKHYRKLIYLNYCGYWILLNTNNNLNYIYNYLNESINDEDLCKRIEFLVYVN